ncbi:UDP-glucose 4-epimerase family protein [Marinobacter sp.]|uniref:UDP-glucose 4-epimerase family protein n=1 Tax=Marinobacter sp. TaxID=50741 RepID=UPI00384B6414
MKPAKKLAISGATGFVGSALVRRLAQETSAGHILALVRSRSGDLPAQVQQAEIGPDGNFAEPLPLAGVDTLIHAAARVHVMNDSSADPLAEFRRVNVEGTLALARQAAKAGIRRFIFLSSIKVNGEATEPGRPFTPEDPPAPQDPYGISKLEAEQKLRALASETGLEVVIIRPVLVYGPGVKANFRAMMSWLERGIPLPLGAIDNRRSLVALDNLVDLVITCIDHPAAAGETFLVSDDEDLSTTELLRRMARALDRPPRLVPVPLALLEAGAAMLGKRDVARRLCGSLQVDIGRTKELLNWQPPVTVDEALRKTADAFREERRKC